MPAAKSHAEKWRNILMCETGTDHFSVHHNRHPQVSDASRAIILEFDERIAAARRTDTAAQSVTRLLNELLGTPIFAPGSSQFQQALENALEKFYSCPRNADDAIRLRYSNELAKACADLAEPDARNGNVRKEHIHKTIEQRANNFLRTNRIDRPHLELALYGQLHRGNSERCSAQKMALETFIKAFPLTVTASGRGHVELLKRLVGMLPALEHHQVIERNAQRRGVLTVEKALAHLSPDEAAEVTAHLMEYVTQLSNLFSHRAIRPEKLDKSKLDRLKLMTEFAGGAGTVATVSLLTTGLSVAPVLVAVPAIAAGVIVGGVMWLGLEKQVQGTALYMLKRQLFRLRETWGQVDAANRQRLIDSFESMRTQLPGLYATKDYTLARFFHNSHIDPSTFERAGGRLNRLGRFPARLHDQLVAPVQAKWRGAPEAMPILEHASNDTSQLFNILHKYHALFKQHEYSRRIPPVDIDWDALIKKFADGDRTRASHILACFNRIKELADYQSPLTRPRILEQLMKMCRALASYDDSFFATFAEVARDAQAHCSNNARQMFIQLWNAVVSEMAMRGEDGLNEPAALLRLADQEFRKEALHRAIADCLGDSVRAGTEVEQYIAVEIALAQSLQIQDAISGMEYANVAKPSVSKENLDRIEAAARDRMTDQDEFFNYLTQYAPLQHLIKAGEEYKNLMQQENTEIKRLENAFLIAQDKALPDEKGTVPTAAARKAFEQATKAYQTRKDEAEAKVLRECIRHLLDQRPDATRIDATPPSRSESPASLRSRKEDAAPILGGIVDEEEGTTSFSQAVFTALGSRGMSFETEPMPNQLDTELFSAFLSAIATIPRALEEPSSVRVREGRHSQASREDQDIGTSGEPQAEAAAVDMQYVAPESSAVRSPISSDDLRVLNYTLVNNQGGGDCMLYALGAGDDTAVRRMRTGIAEVIEQRDDTDARRTYNANLVTAALSQTPQTADQAMEIIHGRYSVPNDVYAHLVRVPGIYLGEDELSAFSQLAENPRGIVLVDSDGTLARFRNGVREAIPYDEASKKRVLAEAIAGADIALYKTPNHWQRIIPSPA